jgi:2-methylcitrate dehydratase PrpD
MTPITRELGAFVAALTYQDIPTAALAVIHTGFADCVGVMLAGRHEPPTKILTEVLNPPTGPASLVFGQRSAGAPEAAWINGVAAHALDYDDVALKGHPSTVLVPAILAEAQALGSSGKDMMTAYAAGYEVWADLTKRDPDHYHAKGWHPTGILGAIGAAAACAFALACRILWRQGGAAGRRSSRGHCRAARARRGARGGRARARGSAQQWR